MGDFKPDNVLVAHDGRVCVADFGLASAGALRGEPSPSQRSGEVAVSGTLTVPGAVMGTPAYMAPEQFRGEAASAAADIFAFCVTAYEALHGQRPFAGETLVELSLAVCSGEVLPAPRGRSLPSGITRLLRRGLHPEVSQRPPSMRALLDALARVPGARRRGLLVAAAAAAIGAGALALWTRGGERCSGADEELAAVWSPAAAEAVRAGFAATGLHYAADTAARVNEGLGRYADAWTREHTEVCEATRVRGEQSERLLDLRMICLDRRRERLAALLGLLAAADAGVVERGVSLVHDLPEVEDCADAQSLVLDEDPAEQIAAEDRAVIEDGVASALLLHQAGRYAEARASVLPAIERARAVAGPRLRSRVFQTYAGMLCFEDDESAIGPVGEALGAVLGAGDLRAFADVAGCMIDLEHERGHDIEVWLRMAEAALASVGGDEQILAKVLTNYGNALHRDERSEEAKAALRRVIELRRQPSNRRPEVLGDALFNLSSVYLRGSNDEEGIRLLNEAIEVWRGHLGPDHPRLLLPSRSLLVVHFRRGELEQARALAERSLASLEKLYGPSHPRLGDMHALLANVLLAAGDFPRTRVHFERALEIARANSSKRRNLAYALANLGNLEMLVGELASARARFDDASAILREIVAPPHPDFVIMEGNYGILELRSGDVAAAEAHLLEAIEIFERVKEPGQSIETDIAAAYAEVLERRGDPRAALAAIDRLQSQGIAGLVLARDRAAALAVQARARWATGEREAALRAAREAAGLYASLRPGYAVEREALARWLAEREGTGM